MNSYQIDVITQHFHEPSVKEVAGNTTVLGRNTVLKEMLACINISLYQLMQITAASVVIHLLSLSGYL